MTLPGTLKPIRSSYTLDEPVSSQPENSTNPHLRQCLQGSSHLNIKTSSDSLNATLMKHKASFANDIGKKMFYNNRLK